MCTTISGGVTVISPEGEVLEEIDMDEHVTNCIFDGSTLYVTATKVSEIHADQRTGSFYRVETDATGLPLIPGRLLGRLTGLPDREPASPGDDPAPVRALRPRLWWAGPPEAASCKPASSSCSPSRLPFSVW